MVNGFKPYLSCLLLLTKGKEMPKITFENEFGVYTIDSKVSVETIDQAFETLITPLLLAAGYQPETIEEQIDYEKQDLRGWDDKPGEIEDDSDKPEDWEL